MLVTSWNSKMLPLADGVNMILDTLAEAFQDEYDVDGSHTANVSQAKEALVE